MNKARNDDEDQRQDLGDGEDLSHLGRHLHIGAIDGSQQT